VAAAILMTGALAGPAQAQDRVARLIMLRLPSPTDDGSPLTDLGSPDSKVLVTQGAVESSYTIGFAPPDWLDPYGGIKTTLAETFPPESVDAMADLVLALLGGMEFQPHDIMHVRQGGPVALRVFLPLGTPKGSVALTGPEGDIMLLGKFSIYQITSGNDSNCSYYGTCNRWAVTTRPSQAEWTVHLAIGHFTR
jgi:hypothetical protein